VCSTCHHSCHTPLSLSLSLSLSLALVSVSHSLSLSLSLSLCLSLSLSLTLSLSRSLSTTYYGKCRSESISHFGRTHRRTTILLCRTGQPSGGLPVEGLWTQTPSISPYIFQSAVLQQDASQDARKKATYLR